MVIIQTGFCSFWGQFTLVVLESFCERAISWLHPHPVKEPFLGFIHLIGGDRLFCAVICQPLGTPLADKAYLSSPEFDVCYLPPPWFLWSMQRVKLSCPVS